jgi:predicted nucleic acid-binding protein
MNSQIICIDAGIIIQLVAFPKNAAIRLQWERWENDNMRITAPGLILFETVDVLCHYRKQDLISQAAQSLALQAVLSLPVELVNDPAVHRRALEIADRFDLPVGYDPHYLALADLYKTELWSYDKRLAKIVNQGGETRVRLAGKRA